MASIARDKNGHRRILFVAPDGRRPTIRLGKVSQRTAEAFKTRVERLLEAKLMGNPIDTDTAGWLAERTQKMLDKLARVGLIAPRTPRAVVSLGPFMRSYLKGRADLKPSTKTVREQVIRDLTEFLGEVRDVATITAGDADDFKQKLVSRGLAPTTIHKRLQVARSFFHAMRRRKLIDENPFDGVNVPATGIQDRQRFISRADIDRVLEACPDHHWRTIVALSRYGGLRTPSETLSLRWQDIKWDSGRIIVTSPKTAHHPGKASRVIPLFAELRPFLEEADELAPPGSVYVVDERFRKAALGPTCWRNANLRTTFQKIVQRAGLEPWPRLFHNLRASRETELVERYPLQVVTSWLGNTPSVAMRHYLMTTDEHFASAIEGPTNPPVEHATDRTESKPLVEAAQNAAQQVHAAVRKESQSPWAAQEKTPVLPGFANSCETLQLPGIAGTGFEPATSRL